MGDYAAVAGQPETFEAEVSAVLTRMRTALAEVIAAVPTEITKSSDLHRAVRIDRKLSWQVFKVACAIDPIAAGGHVPSRASMDKFLKAARKHGVPEPLIDAAARVAADFEELVASHAGDRATFDSMVSALTATESTEQIDLAHRRLAFRGQRHILGVEARTQFKFVALQPSDDPTRLDTLRVEGLIDLRRLHGDAPVVLSYSAARMDDGAPLALERKPLEPTTDPHGLGLLKKFCSQPLPEFRAISVEHGFVRGELVTRGVGRRAAITCAEGHITPAATPRYRGEGHHMFGTAATVRLPCEVLVLDLMLRKDAYGPVKPTASVHAEHLGAQAWDTLLQKRHFLPGSPKVDYLGRGPSVLHTPDVPRYAELGRYVFGRAGWDGDSFDVYRCRLEYPVLPSSVVSRFDLPEAHSE